MPSKAFDPTKYVKHNVSLQEVEEIKMVFDYIDTNRDGIITPRELKDVLLKCGLDGRTSTIHEMIERVDDNNSKQIEFDEFYRLMTASLFNSLFLVGSI